MAVELNNTRLRSDASLQAYYRFEGNSNATIGGINGADTNASYAVANGKFGQGVAFAGTGNISLGDHFTQAGSYTLSAWVNTSSGNNMTILSKMGVGQTQYSLRFIGGQPQIIHYQTAGSTTKYLQANSSGTSNDGNWHHIVGVFDSVTPRADLYVDGVNKGSDTSPTGTRSTATTANCLIGARAYDALQNWTGNIDEVAIFGRVLTASEIYNLYSGGLNNFLQMF